jgi:hypothetical protein
MEIWNLRFAMCAVHNMRDSMLPEWKKGKIKTLKLEEEENKSDLLLQH